LVSRDHVALTKGLFEPATIENRNVAGTIADEIGGPQQGRRNAHSSAPGTEHHPQVFVRQGEVIGFDPVMRQQQPSSAALIHGMQTIARGKLPEKVDIGLEIAVE
jgi:hypothetical protein